MHAFTTIAITAALLSSTLAAPLQPRSCSYNYLPNLWSISQHVPETPNGPFTTPFQVSQDIGKRDLIVSFTGIPSGSYGCQLEFDFKPNPSASVTGIGNPQNLNVYAINGDLPATVTWDSITPVTGSLVGTWTFPTGNDLKVAKTIVINSFVCQPTMNFRIQVANDGAKGYVSDPEDATSGLRISHNC
ncbi:hypothetical protein K432DRAFT_378346 [Lepidopterella palustris CBS 459.81]|uniref:Ubiquitin 3 binding protein But2 C-terminal domain-containing protein n=1 Tax=Lepidopterella palustris CBS 459.81 TaxID=1314670 RepID=A0A8E2EIM8_9PEZI|nr:hypothetical protein K432DRAFT_378346 [Lepidopterella palustris CBS 459.81]